MTPFRCYLTDFGKPLGCTSQCEHCRHRSEGGKIDPVTGIPVPRETEPYAAPPWLSERP